MVNRTEIEKKLAGIKRKINEPLAPLAFTKVGGVADLLVFPKTIEEVKCVVHYANEYELPWLTLGNASNILIRDGGIRGMVISLSEMNAVTLEGAVLEVEAGKNLMEFSRQARKEKLTGLEFACGIPGSVGGAIFMNAGAYGGEISHLFISAEVLLANGQIETWDLEKMNFSYRHSALQEQQTIVLRAKFRLTPGDAQEIQAQMDELTLLRESKQPLDFPSCGSVFKRPIGFFTGKLIQEAGLQGFRIGGAQVSQKHAGFIVNVGAAIAKDYEDLIAHIIHTVKEKFGVELQTEVRIIGESLDKIK